ncbi:MAG: S8 family peptidase [Nitrososphaerota archaeon]
MSRRHSTSRSLLLVTMLILFSCTAIYPVLESSTAGTTTMKELSKNWLEDLRVLRTNSSSSFSVTKKYKILLDTSVPNIHAGDVWMIRDRYGRYLNGTGVAIGIVDTGIDYTHPDFYFHNGSTKILAIWDQTIEGKPPKGFNYGRECTRREIEDRTCPERDTVGHGTHVASIAAGTGNAGPYIGVAPGAYLIVVKSGYSACNGTQWFMDEDEIIDGLIYVVEKARELGLRLVINLSIGSNLGGHDGSSTLEKIIEELIDGGVIVIAAAGNSGDEKIHATGFLKIGGQINLRWFIPPSTTGFGLSLWLDHGDEITVKLKTPSNITVQAPVKNLLIDEVSISLVRSVYDTGIEWLLELSSSGSLPTEGWSIEIQAVETRGSGVWHAWISSDTCSSYIESFLPGEGYIISQNYTIAIPATSRRVIAVGGYVTKNTWTNYLGEVLNTLYNVGDILDFSSRGPTRDGRIKPEIIAPGSVIVAARPVSDQFSRLDVNRYYTVKHGTSMSSPHVAGVAAIILQFMPNASYTDVIKALQSSAKWSREYGERPNNVWGWGKLDARVFYNVSLRLVGLPGDVTATVYINNSLEKLSVSTPVEKVFLRGTSQFVNAQRVVEFIERGVRYVVERGNFKIEDGGNIVIRYIPEYLLEVESELGGEYGGGWYREGTIAVFSARSYLFPEGLEVLFKPISILSGWIDEKGRILKENKIVMDGPHKVTAIYSRDYGLLYTGWIIISSAIILTVIIIVNYVRERKLADRSSYAIDH